MYSLYPAKEITKKIYNNIINSVNTQYKMDIIFMISENSKSSGWSLYNITQSFR